MTFEEWCNQPMYSGGTRIECMVDELAHGCSFKELYSALEEAYNVGFDEGADDPTE